MLVVLRKCKIKLTQIIPSRFVWNEVGLVLEPVSSHFTVEPSTFATFVSELEFHPAIVPEFIHRFLNWPMLTKLISIQFEMEEVFCWHPRYLMSTKEEYWPAERIYENAKLGGILLEIFVHVIFRKVFLLANVTSGWSNTVNSCRPWRKVFHFCEDDVAIVIRPMWNKRHFSIISSFFFYLKGDVSWQLKRKIDVTV